LVPAEWRGDTEKSIFLRMMRAGLKRERVVFQPLTFPYEKLTDLLLKERRAEREREKY
jgi:hypothetical protein